MPKQLIHSDQADYYKVEGHGEVPMDRRGEPLVDLPDGAKMPKELTGDLGPIYKRGVHVGWSKGRYVEIGLVEFDISTQSTVMDGGRSVFASFDRDGLNQLIRAARQARDDAYGKDA